MCHQTVSLIARYLEQNGIPTVVIGSARDIVEYCAVPRFVFTDFPLGNPAGLPWQPEMQKAIVAQALDLLETAEGPRTTVTAPFIWSGTPDWRGVYNVNGGGKTSQMAAQKSASFGGVSLFGWRPFPRPGLTFLGRRAQPRSRMPPA